MYFGRQNNSQWILTMLGLFFTLAQANDCPLVSSLQGRRETICPYSVMILSSYVYQPGVPLTMTLVPDNSVLPFKYYNVEITDIMGTPAGTFTSGDNICRDNTMITHNPRNPFSSNARLFTWMPPNRDVGSLFISLAVGAENPDGSVSLWTPCRRLSRIITPAASIPMDIFQAIQTPLLNHQNPPLMRTDAIAPSSVPPLDDNQNPDLQASPSPLLPVLPIPALPPIPGPPEMEIPIIPTIPIIPLQDENHKFAAPAPQPADNSGYTASWAFTSSTRAFTPPPPPPPTTTSRPRNPWRQRPSPRPSWQHTTTEARFHTNTQGWTTSKPPSLNLWPPGNIGNNLPSFPNQSPPGIASDGYSWCKPFGAPEFQIIPNTDCTQYVMYPNSRVFQCQRGLVFSVVNCGCTYRQNSNSQCRI